MHTIDVEVTVNWLYIYDFTRMARQR